MLTYDTRLEGYVIDLDRERLKNAPRYGVGEEPFADPAFGQRLGDYYGCALSVSEGWPDTLSTSASPHNARRLPPARVFG